MMGVWGGQCLALRCIDLSLLRCMGFGCGIFVLGCVVPSASMLGFVLNRRLLPEMHILYSLITSNEWLIWPKTFGFIYLYYSTWIERHQRL